MRHLNKFWGHFLYKNKRGLFNPDLIPVAKERTVLGNGTVVEKGQRFPSWIHYHMSEKNEDGKACHAVKMAKALHSDKKDGKSVHAVKMSDAKKTKKAKKHGKTREDDVLIYCGQCGNGK